MTDLAEWTKAMLDTARNLRRNGLVGGAIAVFVLAAAPPTAGAHGFTAPLGWWLLLAFCLVPLALSVHLLFDAALFRLAATYETEDMSLSMIDDVLARMGLRARSDRPATLAERLYGCRRLVWLQRAFLAIAFLLYGILLLDAANGGGA